MAFDSLTEKLQNVFKNLRSKGRLTEEDVKLALREVKMALLEADVNFKVVKGFVKDVQERAVGQDVMNGLNPGQMVIKIVNEELIRLMGSETTEIQLQPGQATTVIMMAGLQGAGKTTTTAKIAGKLKLKGNERMCANMQKDRARHNILPLSKFGLMQITRQRVRPAMDVNTTETCPTCFGKGTIKSSILFTDTLESKIDYLVNKLKVKKFSLHVHPYVAAYINQGLVSLKRKWQMKYGFGIKIIPSQKLAFLQYVFYDTHGEEIDMKEEIEIK